MLFAPRLSAQASISRCNALLRLAEQLNGRG